MLNLRISSQTIILWMAGLSLIPRFLTPYAIEIGTIYILFFWLPLLVILPEIVKGYELEKTPILKLPNFTLLVLAFAVLIIFISLLFKDTIYDESADLLIASIRRSLYLVHPIICISLYPLLQKEKKSIFLS
jgi:hypothetical protein